MKGTIIKAINYNVHFIQENGIEFNALFTINEIREKIGWWIQYYKEIKFYELSKNK